MDEVADLDAAVADALARGAHAEAAALVVRTLGPALLGYLLALMKHEADAHEVLAETSLDVLEGIARFRGESAVKTWTYRIAWRTALRFKTSPERRRGRRLETDEAQALIAEVRASTAAYRRTAAAEWLERARADLSLEDQSLLTLRVDRELPWSEVAAVMGEGDEAASLARLRKRFERLKERLRAEAVRAGILGGGDDG